MARRNRRPLGPLDLRTQAILRAVIEEYVTTATPVGSHALVERYGLGVSSATVRNILAELEANGLLTHPHTSAGRIPTDAGYRFYVESIAEAVPLPAVEQLMIRHQFGQVEFASEHWFRLAATTLASVTRAAGLATPAKPRDAHIRRIDLVAINERMASLILVLREGAIKQALVTLESDDLIDQPTLNAVAALLNERLVDLTARRAEARLERPSPSTTAWSCSPGASASGSSRSCASTTRRPSRRSSATACSTSWKPRSSPRATSSAASSAPSRTGPTSASSSAASPVAGRVQVFIGHENQPLDMRDVSLVLAPYGRPGRAIGVVGVLGPTRMSYSQAIGTVRFVSGLMNELVDHLYA